MARKAGALFLLLTAWGSVVAGGWLIALERLPKTDDILTMLLCCAVIGGLAAAWLESIK